MPTSILDPEVLQAFQDARARAARPAAIPVPVDGRVVQVPTPFPSPADWRDCWIYFPITDRFRNPLAPPKAAWNQKYSFRQGGTFEGIRSQLGYLQDLGVNALWLSPVVKNSRPETAGFEYTYPGYNAQDFLTIDARFASDQTEATAERELRALVQEAHARGIYVILDIVLNHAGRVFDYLIQGVPKAAFTDPAVMNGPLGSEPAIRWMDGLGVPRPGWENGLPDPSGLSPDDAVWPAELQRTDFFRRRGSTLSDAPGPQGFVPGDFGTLRQLVHEYDSTAPGLEPLRSLLGPRPVLSILIRAYQYLVAQFDFDGFRIDTVKYIRPDLVEAFGNAMREFALAIGKRNFFTFGEIYDDEAEIAQFVGRNSGDVDGFGLDAALDYPLFFVLPRVVKGWTGVEALRSVFENRKLAEANLISSHGEAGKYFVSFLDNHDQNERFNAPGTPAAQVTMGLALLFSLQGIPCVYYGTEQGLQGTQDASGRPALDALESVREALWGKPGAFDPANPFYQQLQAIAALRAADPALRYGRLYFRDVSGDGVNFGPSFGPGGVIAFSRILSDREVVVVANTRVTSSWSGSVTVDFDLHPGGGSYRVAYSNAGSSGTLPTTSGPGARASLKVGLGPMEIQILVPA